MNKSVAEINKKNAMSLINRNKPGIRDVFIELLSYMNHNNIKFSSLEELNSTYRNSFL